MTKLQDGHSAVDLSAEPGGRVRLTVSVDGEAKAAPTFRAADLLEAARVANGGLPTSDDTRDTAIQSIAKALGWKPEQRPQWPELVLRQLEADGLTITHITDPGVRP